MVFEQRLLKFGLQNGHCLVQVLVVESDLLYVSVFELLNLSGLLLLQFGFVTRLALQ